jgi:serine/threonine-protein kinase
MGEVYRADDLRLGQQVALKFLPEGFRNDPVRLAQFHNEVRTARQISHPNICRVYDIGEVGGQLYLSMEYVDGEDLATSLRRIGRFPEDKAVEIARQLCAGLAAAHERGVLHRDLKPANVMLDGAGKVRVMDFGLAAAGPVTDVRAGTPAYMAPEQLRGREVTARSDIFALGLVLYELFTGRRAFTAQTIADLLTQHDARAATPPSTVVSALDPAIERAILRCLEPDPASRPSSALSVAAALPGGDPLAAALAAGETPSPTMVAAAGEGVGLARPVAIGLYVAVLAGIAAASLLGLRSATLDTLRPDFTPEVMAQKARDALARLGYTERPRDDAFRYAWDNALVEYIQRTDKPAPDWTRALQAGPSPLTFWYRRSQAPLTGQVFHSDLLTPGIVDQSDPPPILAGMIAVVLDHQGRLRFFEAMPLQIQDAVPARVDVDWSTLLSLAGLDPGALQSTTPRWNFLAASDTRAAWTGTWPGTTRELRVEAAALGGRPVAFLMAGPWQQPWRMPDSGDDDTGVLLFMGGLATVVLAGAVWLARRNLREGRVDHRGALSLGSFAIVSMLALWALDVHAVASLGLLGTFLLAICTSVFNGVLLWTIYIALEPVVRRRWPQALVSWTTIFSGRLRDPIVGRDVLFGMALGVAWVAIIRGVDLATRWEEPYVVVELLGGVRDTLAVLVTQVFRAIRTALLFFLLLFLWRLLLRRQWAAAIAFAATFAGLDALGGERVPVVVPTSFAVTLMAALVAVRWGLTSLTVGVLTTNLLLSAPLSRDLSAWYAGNMLLFVAVNVALATWAFYTCVAGRARLA